MNSAMTIPPERVLPRSLAEICADIEGEGDFQYTKDLVQAYLFSNYPERRVIAAKDIKSMWGRNTNIVTTEHEGIIWAYLHYAQADTYVLVGRYLTTDPVFEEVPDDEEREMGEKLLRSNT